MQYAKKRHLSSATYNIYLGMRWAMKRKKSDKTKQNHQLTFHGLVGICVLEKKRHTTQNTVRPKQICLSFSFVLCLFEQELKCGGPQINEKCLTLRSMNTRNAGNENYVKMQSSCGCLSEGLLCPFNGWFINGGGSNSGRGKRIRSTLQLSWLLHSATNLTTIHNKTHTKAAIRERRDKRNAMSLHRGNCR